MKSLTGDFIVKGTLGISVNIVEEKTNSSR